MMTLEFIIKNLSHSICLLEGFWGFGDNKKTEHYYGGKKILGLSGLSEAKGLYHPFYFKTLKVFKAKFSI